MTVTTTPAERTRFSFNPFEPGYFADPSVQLNALREQEAVHFVEFTGGYMVTGYDDASRLLRDRTVGSTAANATPTPSIDAERAAAAQDPAGPNMLRVDGDDHARMRRLVAQAFTPRAIERWRARATELTDELLDVFEHRGRGDALFEFALP